MNVNNLKALVLAAFSFSVVLCPEIRSVDDVSDQVASDRQNFEKLSEILVKGDPIIKKAQDKNLILVLGDTGAGKSTVINYLLGYKMKNVLNEETLINEASPFRKCDDGSYEPIPKKADGTYDISPEVFAMPGETIGSSTTLFPNILRADGQKLFPQILAVSEEGSESYYCDCPGFSDNRGEIYKVCASVLTESVVRVARNVKVMVVVDDKSMQTKRGEGLADLGKTLGEVFHWKSEEPVPILFVINKLGDVADYIKPVHIAKRAARILETMRNATIAGEEEFRAAQQAGMVLDLMQRDDGKNIIPVQIFDGNFKSARQIQDALEFQPLVQKMLFRFGFDASRSRFAEEMREIVMDVNKVLEERRYLPRHLEYYKEQADFARERTERYKRLLEGGESDIVREENAREIQKEIGKIRESMHLNAERIEKARNEIEKIRVRRGKLNSDHNVQIWQDYIAEERLAIFGLLGWTRKEFSYSSKIPFRGHEELIMDSKGFWSAIKGQWQSATDVGSKVGMAVGIGATIGALPEVGPAAPAVGFIVGGVVGTLETLAQGTLGTAAETLHRVVVLPRNIFDGAKGRFDPVEVDEKLRVDGTYRYRSVYTSAMGMPGGAMVTLYVAHNQLPDVVEQIKLCDELINNREPLLASLETEQIQNGSYIRELEASDVAACEKQKKFLEAQQRGFEERRRMCENSYRVTEERLGVVEADYKGRLPLFEAIQRMIKVMPFDDPDSHLAVARFRKLYENVEPQSVEVELPESMVDPISLIPLLDPVQTSCGHVFDRFAIQRWLQESREKSCPLCRTAVEERQLVGVPRLAALVEEKLDKSIKREANC